MKEGKTNIDNIQWPQFKGLIRKNINTHSQPQQLGKYIQNNLSLKQWLRKMVFHMYSSAHLTGSCGELQTYSYVR